MPLAHAGGIDEMLYIVLPFAVFVLVMEARRRKYVPPEDEAAEKPPDE